MSLRTALSVAALVGLSSPGLAAVSCPSSVSGRALLSSGGGTLYDGPVSDGADLAPDARAGTPPRAYVNTWHLRRQGRVTLVCHYAGLPGGVSFPLSGERQCQQTQSSFRCE